MSSFPKIKRAELIPYPNGIVVKCACGKIHEKGMFRTHDVLEEKKSRAAWERALLKLNDEVEIAYFEKDEEKLLKLLDFQATELFEQAKIDEVEKDANL